MPTRLFSDIEASAHRCRCGGDVGAPRFGCLECGAPCCTACAVPLESIAYCGRCAATLLGVVKILKAGPFELF
jgi:hypothetical protein